MHCEYTPEGVCPSKLEFDLDGDVVTNIKFTDGCDGNLKALSAVVNGMTVSQIEQYFSNITCGSNTTSCSMQLAHAVRVRRFFMWKIYVAFEGYLCYNI